MLPPQFRLLRHTKAAQPPRATNTSSFSARSSPQKTGRPVAQLAHHLLAVGGVVDSDGVEGVVELEFSGDGRVAPC